MKIAILILSIIPFLFIACSKKTDELVAVNPPGIDGIVIPEIVNEAKVKYKGDDAKTYNAPIRCVRNYLQNGYWERTQTLDSLGNPMGNTWGMASSDTLIFSTDTTMMPFMNIEGFRNVYASLSQLNSTTHYNKMYKFDSANCTIDMAILSCGIVTVRYNITELTANSLILEAETDVSSLNTGGAWFMALDPHTIIFTKIP
ncbi:MAG: hypothetical protein MK212_11755 [Saprospiraceae bacterium]|nr:hypothetical protein [Saprospiraceae bacterium]